MDQIERVELPGVEEAIDQIIAFLWQGLTDPHSVAVIRRELRRILVDLALKSKE